MSSCICRGRDSSSSDRCEVSSRSREVSWHCRGTKTGPGGSRPEGIATEAPAPVPVPARGELGPAEWLAVEAGVGAVAPPVVWQSVRHLLVLCCHCPHYPWEVECAERRDHAPGLLEVDLPASPPLMGGAKSSPEELSRSLRRRQPPPRPGQNLSWVPPYSPLMPVASGCASAA